MTHIEAQRISAGLLLTLGSAIAQAQTQAEPYDAALEGSPWFAHVQAGLQIGEYEFQPVPHETGVWSAPNRAQALRSRVSARGLELFPREADAHGVASVWKLSLRTSHFGRQGALVELDSPAVSSDGVRIQLDHGALQEWFENRAEGLEQGWTIATRPSGGGLVWIGLEPGGGFALTIDAGARGGVLVGAEGAIELPYRGLVVRDARGRELPAGLEARSAGFGIRIDDAGAQYPLTVDPVLNGPAWTADGDQTSAHYGFCVASAGDVNGDGYGDVIVGAPEYDLGQIDEGRVWVYHGSSAGLAGPAWSADGNQVSAAYGSSVASAGDINGDGYGDVIVGAPTYDFGQTDEGQVWVYHGSPTGLAGPAWSADGDQDSAEYGLSVASAGDVNGDGYGDVVIGAPYYSLGETQEGRVWLYHGSPAGLSGSAWNNDSDMAVARYGFCVASAGDVNGDGYDDVFIAAPWFSLGSGRVWLYHGSPAGISGAAWVAEGGQIAALYGYSIAGAGDVDGDGYDDVVVGAPIWDGGQTDEGRAWLYHGSAVGLGGVAWNAEGNQVEGRYGWSVAGAGDVDGDGFGDVLIGASLYNVDQADEGSAWLYRGSSSGLSVFPAWGDQGDQVNCWYGYSVAGAGDVDGDGFDDVLIGAPNYDQGQADEGLASLYTGCRRLGTVYCIANQNSTGSGAHISAWCSASVAAGSLQLESEPVPNQMGIFFHGPNQTLVPFGNGYLCVSGSTVRGAPIGSAEDRATYVYDNSDAAHSLAAFVGTTRHFQHWFRDPAAGGQGFNTSNAVSIAILP